jgi:hypothetical protein
MSLSSSISQAAKSAGIPANEKTISFTLGFISACSQDTKYSNPDQPKRHANNAKNGTYDRFNKEYVLPRYTLQDFEMYIFI